MLLLRNEFTLLKVVELDPVRIVLGQEANDSIPAKLGNKGEMKGDDGRSYHGRREHLVRGRDDDGDDTTRDQSPRMARSIKQGCIRL